MLARGPFCPAPLGIGYSTPGCWPLPFHISGPTWFPGGEVSSSHMYVVEGSNACLVRTNQRRLNYVSDMSDDQNSISLCTQHSGHYTLVALPVFFPITCIISPYLYVPYIPIDCHWSMHGMHGTFLCKVWYVSDLLETINKDFSFVITVSLCDNQQFSLKTTYILKKKFSQKSKIQIRTIGPLIIGLHFATCFFCTKIQFWIESVNSVIFSAIYRCWVRKVDRYPCNNNIHYILTNIVTLIRRCQSCFPDVFIGVYGGGMRTDSEHLESSTL